VLEAVAAKAVDGAVENADAPLPGGPAVAIADAGTAPAYANQPIGEAGLLMQVALPDQAGVVIRGKVFPADLAEEPVVKARGALMREGIALDMFAAAYQQRSVFASAGPGVACTQGTVSAKL